MTEHAKPGSTPPPAAPATPMDPRRAAEAAAVDRLESVVAILLRIGALASLAIVVAGAAVTLAQHPGYLSEPALLEPLRMPHATTRTVGGVLRGLARGEGEAITLLGLMLLIATPVMRVALSAMTFMKARDRAFSLVTLTVLALLLLSFLLGKAG